MRALRAGRGTIRSLQARNTGQVGPLSRRTAPLAYPRTLTLQPSSSTAMYYSTGKELGLRKENASVQSQIQQHPDLEAYLGKFSAEIQKRGKEDTSTAQDQDTHRALRNLTQRRVENLLLVCSLYDSYTFEEDGLLGELLFTEYMQYNLTKPPIIERVSNATEALTRLRTGQYDLMVSLMRVEGEPLNLVPFITSVKELAPNLPVLLLALSPQELRTLDPRVDQNLRVNVDKRKMWEMGKDALPGLENAWLWPFVWQGDVSIFLAMIKAVEDRLNVHNDIEACDDVQVILLVEDNVRFYSSYLPQLYSELIKQMQSLMPEVTNPMEKLLLQRARPKVLLATNYEEGIDLFNRYQDRMLGVITDAAFPRGGQHEMDAGLVLAAEVRDTNKNIPVLMQSADTMNGPKCAELGITYLDKSAPSLLADLRKFMQQELGFGDFVFRASSDAPALQHVSSVSGFLRALETVPAAAIQFHGEKHHFSKWFLARSEIDVAHVLREKEVSEFADAEAMRRFIVNTVRTNAAALQSSRKGQGIVTTFNPKSFNIDTKVARIGKGALGGKGRGYRFLHSFLDSYLIEQHFGDVRITVPRSVILATGVFDEFVDDNELLQQALAMSTDAAVCELFMKASLPDELSVQLRKYLDLVETPLAVRSSSLFEDAFQQPFAGVYSTYMLPNNSMNPEHRFNELARAIKMVWASTYFQEARAYAVSSQNRIEEEKMAVIIQEVTGMEAENKYMYPCVAGVACSVDFYPHPDTSEDDGCITVSAGLGANIVEGGKAVRVSLGKPGEPVGAEAQTHFRAMDLAQDPQWQNGPLAENSNLGWQPLQLALNHGFLTTICTEKQTSDHTVVQMDVHGQVLSESIVKASSDATAELRDLSLKQFLSGEAFDLARVMSFILRMGSAGLACPVEIEFAVNVRKSLSDKHELSLLQIRPMASVAASNHLMTTGRVGLTHLPSSDAAILATDKALGHGMYDNISDVVYIKPESFDRNSTTQMAEEIGKLNKVLAAAKRPYIIIGPGRWGSQDKQNGIPVGWDDISGVQIMIETDIEGATVEPSQAAHFFQNVTSFGIGYLTVSSVGSSDHVLDFDFLDKIAESKGEFLRHVQFEQPLQVVVDGLSHSAVIMKPGKDFEVYVGQLNSYMQMQDIPGGNPF